MAEKNANRQTDRQTHFRIYMSRDIYCSKFYLHSTACPSGFQNIDGYCLKIGNGTKSFDEAKVACQDMGGFMAEPRTEEIQTAMKRLTFDSPYLWIGLREDSWYKWETDGEALTFAAWDAGQPNNYGGNQDCAAMRKADHEWDDAVCSQHYGYACQANIRE